MEKKSTSIHRSTVSLSNLKNVKEALPFSSLRTLLRTIPFCIVLILLSATLSFGAPKILYTDILSGPNTGGEDNKGIYLSIFGKDFGDSGGLGTTTKVYINKVEVGAYKYLGPSNGRSDVQQISVQPGSNVSTGAIKVTVNGVDSNTDHTFTVRPGNIYFVDNVSGGDPGTVNDITDPYATVNYVYNLAAFGAGDTIVMRGTGTNWTETDSNGLFLFANKTIATSDSRITIMGYPGETPTITRKLREHTFRINDSVGYHIFSGLKTEEPSPSNQNIQTAFKLDADSRYIRIINNDLSGHRSALLGTFQIANSHFVKILGNYVHDDGWTLVSNNSHQVYFEIDPTDVEIAWNHFANHTGGRCIQIKNGTNFSIHDNLIHDIAVDGIIIGKSSVSGFLIYNNVLYNVNTDNQGRGGIRITNAVTDVEIYNNTLYNIYVIALSLGSAKAIVTNNIVYLNGSVTYHNGDNTTGTNNVWYGSSDSTPAWDKTPVTSDPPKFVDLPGKDFHLGSHSPAIDAGVNIGLAHDFDGNPRPQNDVSDIGAYEFMLNPPANLRIINIVP